MKRIYLVPETEVITLDVVQMVASTIRSTDGNTGIDMGTGNTPGTADVKGDFDDDDDW